MIWFVRAGRPANFCSFRNRSKEENRGRKIDLPSDIYRIVISKRKGKVNSDEDSNFGRHGMCQYLERYDEYASQHQGIAQPKTPASQTRAWSREPRELFRRRHPVPQTKYS